MKSEKERLDEVRKDAELLAEEPGIGRLAYGAPCVFCSDYQGKIARDAHLIAHMAYLLDQAHGLLNAQAFTPEEYDEWEKLYLAQQGMRQRIAAGLAFITDTKLGGD